MNRAKKLSGAEFKKKRRDHLESDAKLRNCFKKWLVTNFSVEKQIISEDICNEVDNDSTAEVAATSSITNLNSYHPLELIEEEIFIGQSQDEFGPNDSEAQEDSLIPEHENSNEHQRCYSDWKNLEKNLKERKTLDSDLQRVINGELKKWRDILKVIVDAILFCAKNNLALRGSTEVIGEQNSGIFLNLIELISHYYPLVAERVASVKAKKTTTSYFSPRIQNELIELLGQKVRNEILSNARKTKYYSVLFDCTPDASHKEQMTQIIRYVHIAEETCTIKESFVDFIESHEKTGKGLAAEITEKLEKDGLSISDCRGQAYDNGANMSGKYNGVQAHIHSLNEFARFVPCAAHTLNLVGVHAAEVSPLIITFFGKVQAIFNFFSSSTLRWEKLMKTLTISLKGNSDTRWSAKKEAIIPLHRQIKEVLQVLESIIHTPKTNAVSVCSAKELIIQIDFSFLCLLDFGVKFFL
ncbi:zinc finger MYM-type protein 1-like [Hydra vulgaris]|uniref:Zinc finger MYM-type protein 1-like n=1 Tax=Hydra vulgaris TaxID=6087 RepID=A0ABM4BMN0_HYDVU